MHRAITLRLTRMLTYFLVTLMLLTSGSIQVVAQAGETEGATPSPASGRDEFRDPSGRYSVPIPTNWTVEEQGDVVVLSDPDDDITVSIVVLDGGDAGVAITEAWAIVDPSFRPEAQIDAVEQEVPSSPGVDITLVITYDLGQVSGNVVQVAAQVADGTSYVLIFQGSLDAVTRRASQVGIVASGFTITAVELVDLSGVKPEQLRGSLVTEFEAAVTDLLTRLDIPGASVAVVQGGKIVYAEGFGVKAMGGMDEVTADTLMMIGSTTKSMTTMMMATEVDDGLLDWDQPVVEILPDFALADPKLTETITVRNLVCACTGVPRRDLELAFNASELTPEDVIESLKEFDVFTAFGEAFQYSNQMVAVGGYAAAAATKGDGGDLGEIYADELQARVLDPIGMPRTTLSFDVVIADDDYAMPHGLRLDYDFTPIPLEAETFVEPVAPAGGIWSSANEMARYALTELSRGVSPDGTRVVSTKNLEETWQPHVAVDAETDYGLGWFVGEYKGQALIAHGGNTYGFTSDLAFLPDADLGIVILANAQAANLFTEGVRIRLLELLFDQPAESEEFISYQIEDTEQTKQSVIAQFATEADEESVTPFLGRYTNSALGEIMITFDDNRLMLDAGEFQSELRPLKQVVANAPGYFLFDPPISGLPVELREGGDDGDSETEVVLHVGTERYVFSFIDNGPLTAPATPVVLAPPVVPQTDGSPEAELGA